ncbi:MAG: AI-2E family transporter [Alphaproteobacteria bacterium]|nr:AI-2E family transporter [Alphaproteobacteria bacterium]
MPGPSPVSPGSSAADPIAGPSDAERSFLLQAGVVAIVALYFAREVLIPITLAILLSFLLAPIVTLLERVRFGRVPAVLLAVVAALGIITSFGGVIGSQVAQLAGNIPQYAGTIEKKVAAIRAYTVGRVDRLVATVDHAPAPPQAGESPSGPLVAAPTTPSGTAPQPAAPALGETRSSPLALAERYLSPALSPLATIGIVFVVAIFILLQREDLRDRFIRLFGATDLHRTTAALDDAARRLRRYFLTQLAVNTTFGVVISTGLYFIGVPNPLLWGMLSGLLRFVPYIGSFISAALPIALAAAVDPGWSMAIWTAALYVVVELVVSQAVEPLLYGHSTGLSPLAVIVAAIFWSWLWGPIGLLLSMPLTLCLVVLGRYAERLEFLDVLLGDRPALTPIESFYQRILAGDADEAQEHAEQLLKECSLSAYYDEVALKGLQLAANDAERGVLRRDQLERMKNTINGLVAELDAHDDREPAGSEAAQHGDAPQDERAPSPPMPVPGHPRAAELAPAWRGETPVLCVAGRGPLDEAASAMLAQLLRKHGLGARTVPYEAVSREGIGSLATAGVAMVCISYLDISGTPSHLRYLIRRLRRTLPQVPILVGLWPAEDEVLKDDQARAAIGADCYATALRDAVRFCMEAAHKASRSRGREQIEGTRLGLKPPGAALSFRRAFLC